MFGSATNNAFQMYLLCTIDLLCLATHFARENQVFWRRPFGMSNHLCSSRWYANTCETFECQCLPSLLNQCNFPSWRCFLNKRLIEIVVQNFLFTVNLQFASYQLQHTIIGMERSIFWELILHMTSFYFNVWRAMKFLSVDTMIPITSCLFLQWSLRSVKHAKLLAALCISSRDHFHFFFPSFHILTRKLLYQVDLITSIARILPPCPPLSNKPLFSISPSLSF